MRTITYRSVIVDETSAGLTALQIYRNGELIYSHNYFARGASSSYWHHIMTAQAKEDMLALETAETWDGNTWADADGYPTDVETGVVFDHLKSETAFEYIEYTRAGGFVLLNQDYRGQSSELAIDLGLISPEQD